MTMPTLLGSQEHLRDRYGRVMDPKLGLRNEVEGVVRVMDVQKEIENREEVRRQKVCLYLPTPAN